MLLLKSVPFLLIGLPVLLILLGALFRSTNPIGLLLAIVCSLAFLVGGQWVARHFFEMTDFATYLLLILQTIVFIWITPWAGFFLSVSLADQDVPNSPAGKSTQKVHDTYKQMSPENQERVNRFATDVFRFACKAGSEHLARKGKPNAAATADRLSKF